jgi:mannose-1-phosphate guanylyltransferase
MILAAGFGTRLLPHSAIRPKPLFPILNTPLLLLTIRRLQNSGFDHIIINCHHLREQIVAAVQGIPGVILQEEETILGTGGGLRRALCHMRAEPLLVTNGDIYHTVDFKTLYETHVASAAKVTLAMHDYPRFNTVPVRGDRVAGFGEDTDVAKLAFTGLHVLDPEILRHIPEQGASCIIELYRKLMQQGHVLRSHRVDDCFWTDMGTPEDYLALHGGLLLGDIPCWEELSITLDSPFVVEDDAEISEDCDMLDWVCLGAVKMAQGARLQRTVVWDDITIPPHSVLTDVLVSAPPNGSRGR